MSTSDSRAYRYIVDPEYVPDVHDLAQQLSRVPRWNGQTRRPWSVLHHSLAFDRVRNELDPEWRLGGLLHDIEESVIGDVPRPFKTVSMRQLGWDVRVRLLREAFDLPPLPYSQRQDDITAWGEAKLVGYPEWEKYFEEMELSPEEKTAGEWAVRWVLDLHRWEVVLKWVTAVNSLLEHKQIKELAA